jgi:hypothetical protein
VTDTPPPAPPSPPPVPHIPVGAHVTSRHAPEWGKGIVMGKDGRLARVLFVAHPSRKPVAVAAVSLIVEHVSTWPDPSKAAAASTLSAKPSKGSPKNKKKKLAPPDATPEEGSSSEPSADSR